MSSFIQTIDTTAKSLIYTKFAPIMGLPNTIPNDQNTNLVFVPKSIVLRKIAEKRGETTVEFMSIWRTGIEFDWERQNSAIARQGLLMEYADSTKRHIITVKAVPASLTYDLWFWSRNLDTLTSVAESYLLWKHNSPQLILNYLGRYPMEMYLKFGSVSDETDYDIYEKGLYFVYKMPITLDGWILSTFTTPTVLEIILDIFLREGQNPNYVDTLIDEFIITATP